MAFLLVFIVILLSLHTKLSLCDPRATEAARICTNTSAAPSDRRVFVANFRAAVDAMSAQVATQGYGSAVNGSGNMTVYFFGECMKDLSRNDCDHCFAQIKIRILSCMAFPSLIRGGRISYDGCYIRYDEYMFFNESLSAVNRTVCGSVDFGGNKTLFGENVVDLVRNLSVEAPNNDGFFVGSVTTGNLSVYGLAQCWEFVNGSGCGDCLTNAVSQIGSCLSMEDGRVVNSGCYMRYSTSKFYYNDSSTDPHPGKGGGNRLAVVLAATSAGVAFLLIAATISFFARKKRVKKRRERKQLGALLVSVNKSRLNFSYETLEHATNYFHNSNKLGQGGSGSVYKGILPDGQVVAVKRLFFNTRQWVDHFFNEVNLISGNRLAVILAATSAGVAFLLIAATMSFFARKKHVKKRRERKQLGALLVSVNKSKLNFSYETLEHATNYFSNSNKLGQGGSGSVYKGILPDGQIVAVKRLFFNTRQWVDHFFNEVNLISEIDHKNLVKLLGCSITGPESLLVYEFVANQSVHDRLFVNKSVQPLTWEERYKIILGTAEGLAYLHEESNLRIIHRDIKLSNVLLDEDFSPKIADFGLARLFPEDKTHISTAIAGTLGYMAPEYIVRGKLTEKADVYSFGVLVMEVVSGKKNISFAQNSHSILQMAWNLYRLETPCEAVDPSLQGKFEEEEARKLLQIGLLCVQASAELRPSMSMVVKMLKDNHGIPQPTQPPFLIAGSGSAESSTQFAQSRTSHSRPESHNTQSSGNYISENFIEPR